MTRYAAALLLAALAACSGTTEGEEANGAREAAPQPAEQAAANAAAPAAPPPAAVPTAPMSPTGYALVGTEPFWGGTVTGTSVRYMVPERQFGDVVETRRSYGPGSETYSGSFRGRPFVLTLTRAACSDGMSERPSPLRRRCRWPAKRGAAAPIPRSRGRRPDSRRCSPGR